MPIVKRTNYDLNIFLWNFSWPFKIIIMYRKFRQPLHPLHLPHSRFCSLQLSYKSLRTVGRDCNLVGWWSLLALLPQASLAAMLPKQPSLPCRQPQRPICLCIQIRLSIQIPTWGVWSPNSLCHPDQLLRPRLPLQQPHSARRQHHLRPQVLEAVWFYSSLSNSLNSLSNHHKNLLKQPRVALLAY